MIGEVLGEYRITSFLGAGGMGRVYGARSLRDGSEVALKVLSVDAEAEEIVERMKREAMALSCLSHPCIVTFRGLHVTAHHLFYAMDLLEGVDLESYLLHRHGEGRSPELDELYCLAEDLASALAHAHGRGVLHRDLKPGNVMVCSDGRIALVDFGLAKLSDLATLTGQGEIVGTVEYFAPEQLRGEATTAATDVYQLGLLLWEAATGELPFDARRRPMQGAVRRTRKDCPPLRSKRPDLPTWFEDVVGRCLQRRPEDRLQTGRDLVALLHDGGASDVDRRTASSERWRARVAAIRSGEAAVSREGRLSTSVEALERWRQKETRVIPKTGLSSPWVAVLGFLVTLLLGALFMGIF